MVRRAMFTVLALLLTLVIGPAGAQAQAGPEVRRFDSLVGKWRLDIDIKATATTQAIKASGVEDCELFANMHIVCKSDAGAYRLMRTISYLAALKQDPAPRRQLRLRGTRWDSFREAPGPSRRMSVASSHAQSSKPRATVTPPHWSMPARTENG